ncbi:hypothetical protein [Trichocoleus sp. FACHB-90]|nr:hypothetical protein [Trichocoleus sp. FACHB-90]
MVGIVIVSDSQKLALGVQVLVKLMDLGSDVLSAGMALEFISQ